MKWNIQDIAFLHAPDVFSGAFDNAMMQERHERQMMIKIEVLKDGIARETDPLKAMLQLHKKDHLPFLLNNQELFAESGRLEEAVVLLYCRQHGPFLSAGDVGFWGTLFEGCDKAVLYGLGDPVSFVATTVYRGAVMGNRRSLSWSADRETAEWYAERWKDPVGGGEIFEVDITRNNVLIRLKQSREAEVILDPQFIKSAELRVFTP
jgi:hypothetical protein